MANNKFLKLLSTKEWSEVRLALCHVILDMYDNINSLSEKVSSLDDSQKKLVVSDKVQNVKMVGIVSVITIMVTVIVQILLKKL